MHVSRLGGALVVALCCGAAIANEVYPALVEAPAPGAPASNRVILLDDVSPKPFIPVPAHAVIRRHYVTIGSDGALTERETNRSDPPGTLVYANTSATALYPPPPGWMLADDIFTIAVGGSDLSAYEILIGGGGDGSGTNGFTVDVALYDACPGASGQVISGTEASVTFDDDGLHLLTIDCSASGVAMPSSAWIGASFSRYGAGWATGTRAELGFTDDLYHYPTIPCTATFSGTTYYAGFYARVFCSGAITFQYLAYLNSTAVQMVSVGAGRTILDDIELFTNECVLGGYEVGLSGSAGPYTAQIELWADCNSESAIPGTSFVFQGMGDGSLEVARTSFEEGVELPLPAFWLAVSVNAGSTGPMLAGEPIIGNSQDMFARWDEPGAPDQCTYQWFGGNPYAAFWVNAYCLGSPPMGACCNTLAPPGQEPCREMAQLGCEDGRWLEGATCDPDPFNPPCGTHACCLPDGTCVDLTEEDCEADDGLWYEGQFCKLGPGVTCPFFACLDGQGNCCEAKLGTGCANQTCCERVCAMDGWCCGVEWDQICADEARQVCSFSCPNDEIAWLDPPDGVVDARQPHDVADADALMGILSVTVAAPSGGADACCWTLCETEFGGQPPNAIANVEDHGDDTYAINLVRPMTPGAVTTITYGDGYATATFTAHPANVDGNIQANPADIVSLIDCLNGIEDWCPWGIYSCDIDHSGECAPADILRVIDLLGGAGAFDSWNHIDLPANPDICP